jgi:hypothetical protein
MMLMAATNGADPFVPLAVIGIALLAIAVGIAIFVKSGSAYDEIGGGVFDRSGGDDGYRPTPDAEYEEFGEAMAEYCARDERRTRLGPFPPSPTSSS